MDIHHLAPPKKSPPCLKAGIFLAFWLLLCSMSAVANAAEDIYLPIKQKLQQDGLGARQVSAVFQPPPAPLYKLVAQTFRLREGHLNYDQFLEAPALAKARRFMDSYRDTLARAEKTYDVDPRVIVAILLVETHFGSYTGKTPTLGVLSTFALLDRKSSRDRVWALMLPRDRERWGREGFDKKCADRAKWAYGELVALVRLSETGGTRVEALKGSVMGAVGWCQFLPSSLVTYGLDGDMDGRVDLFNPRDAIFSVANYLKGHGWCEAKDRARQEEVIWTYNHSRPYVATVLGIASLLEREG